MKKEEKRQHSIRSDILKVTTFSIYAMFCLCVILILVEYMALYDMKEMIGKASIYASYYNSCEQTHQTMLEYMSNHKEESREKCMYAIEEFTYFSEELRTEFMHPKVEDHYYLSMTYRECVEKFLEMGEETLSEEQMKVYTEAERIRSYLQYNLEALNTIRSQVITQGSQKIFDRWKIQLIVFFIAAGVSSFFIWNKAKHVVKKILLPILSLTEQAKRIQNGDLQMISVEVEEIENQETFVLTNAFSEMMVTIQKQMEELKEKILLTQKLHMLEVQNIQFQMQLTETKMQLMQSMVNPHFLFNCLNMLSSLAYLERAQRTRDAAGMIAGYLRNSLSFVGRKISLMEEFEHTQQYIEIQKLRFGERIQFLTECSTECKDIIVPGMILQPLVENSISHGLKTVAQGGYIKICAKKTKEELCITVSDNGKGIKKEKIEQLEKDLKSFVGLRQQGIGLYNVATRMKMVFQERFAMKIYSENGKGTRIELKIHEKI